MDFLIARGFQCVSVVDIAGVALRRAQARLPGARVNWIEADVVRPWAMAPVDIWHDRAVFHFLIEPGDRAAYTANLRETVKPGGHAILATFAPDGPERCSGLPVVRYSPPALAAAVGAGFRLIESVRELHRTPDGRTQSFNYCRFVRSKTQHGAG